MDVLKDVLGIITPEKTGKRILGVCPKCQTLGTGEEMRFPANQNQGANITCPKCSFEYGTRTKGPAPEEGSDLE